MSEETFVTCPVCGKVTQKSFFTYSEVKCQRCRKKLIAYADQGVVVSMDMDKSRSKEEVDRLELYDALGRNASAEWVNDIIE